MQVSLFWKLILSSCKDNFLTGDLFNKAYRDVKTGLALWIQQFIALLIKRFHHIRRRRKLFISQILLPTFFVVAAMTFSLLRPPRGTLPSLRLTPSQYGEPNYVFIANVRKNFNLTKRIVEAAVKGPGLGMLCFLLWLYISFVYTSFLCFKIIENN